MSKLYFKFGAMKCEKTSDLIKTWYDYKEKEFNVIIMKPGVDKKAGGNIQSRANEELPVDYVVSSNENIYDLISKYIIDYNLDVIDLYITIIYHLIKKMVILVHILILMIM